MTDEERRLRQRAHQAKYQRSPKGKASLARYRASAKRQAVVERYNKTEKATATRRRFEAQPHRILGKRLKGILTAKVCRDLADAGMINP